MWLFKVLLLFTFAIILFQDVKDRQVWWFLYPLVGTFAGFIFYDESELYSFLINVIINLIFVLILLSLSFVYATMMMREKFLKVIGLGDVLLFIFLAFTFSSISFLILFIFSLIFSMLMHILLKNRNTLHTVPLAGYMSLFFGSIYFSTLFYNCNFLYLY